MIYNKKGLSIVVTTLIIILLVLVAIGIIWVVIKGIIEKGTTDADYQVKCLAVDVAPTDVSCIIEGGGTDNCTVTLTRKAGGEEIGGVKMVFYNATTSSIVFDSRTTGIPAGAGGLAELTTKQAYVSTNLVDSNKIAVTVFFVDETGEDQICKSQTKPFTFA